MKSKSEFGVKSRYKDCYQYNIKKQRKYIYKTYIYKNTRAELQYIEYSA